MNYFKFIVTNEPVASLFLSRMSDPAGRLIIDLYSAAPLGPDVMDSLIIMSQDYLIKRGRVIDEADLEPKGSL